MFSLKSPHRGDSNENTKYTFLNIKKKICLIIPNLQLRDFFLGTQERVRNIRGKRAISVRAIEVLLYVDSSFYKETLLIDIKLYSLFISIYDPLACLAYSRE